MSKEIFDPNDEKIKSAVNLIIKKQKFSTALMQAYLGKGHEYVSELAEWLDQIGVIGPEDEKGSRKVLISSMDEFIKKAGETSVKEQKTRDDTTSVSVKKASTNSHGWIWVLVVFVIIILGVVGYNMKKPAPSEKEPAETVQEDAIYDYTDLDAKLAYENLTLKGYSVKFVFDRANNGGFTDEQFQDFVVNDSFGSESYDEMPLIVTNQTANGKNVVLTIEYKSSVDQEKSQQDRESRLEEKLSIITAMSACELYGERNYRNFKMHSIIGKIDEHAVDDDTWFLKYTADADGYKNLNMECYVTGTDSNPSVKDFKLY